MTHLLVEFTGNMSLVQVFVPDIKFHFGVSRAQRGQSGKFKLSSIVKSVKACVWCFQAATAIGLTS